MFIISCAFILEDSPTFESKFPNALSFGEVGTVMLNSS